jgi:hypothetical protein
MPAFQDVFVVAAVVCAVAFGLSLLRGRESIGLQSKAMRD